SAGGHRDAPERRLAWIAFVPLLRIALIGLVVRAVIRLTRGSSGDLPGRGHGREDREHREPRSRPRPPPRLRKERRGHLHRGARTARRPPAGATVTARPAVRVRPRRPAGSR